MIITDKLYGTFEIEEVLERLINSNEVQRLKNIHQGGSSYLVNPKWNVTRYDHSVGTMLLIRILGGTVEEQIAGLLHDISHTAFSHVVDFALKNNNEDYHEEIYSDIIEKSQIKDIILKFGYDYRDILFNESKWTILERSAPKLCADRLDYTLRDLCTYGYITEEEVNNFLNNIEVYNGEIVGNSLEAGEWFVNTYYKEVVDFFMNPLNVYGYDRLSKAIAMALDLKEITLDDLLLDDYTVYELLLKSKSNKVIEMMKGLNPNVKVSENCNEYDIYQKQKIRIIDPTLKIDNKICSTSELSIKTKKLTEKVLLKADKGIFVKVEKS